ncbi:hypothetical protein A2714_02520 [Candidatus Woesebacteria bacterium RIFCSPHIGHO2_01_FULL_38_9]|uniref:Uncharacterized protein n=1 Tax=Candidatus Woesebacteria bacterium RIFCSPHIGHO2_01_FULL_38_9 TaxID=1802492 RepID=A0A1F7Y3E3_9BACT|nr:MAG: hypothetical protein A2714_02520 [Candidatus Woesebacteria bacterium RIFCSPHIGHO2_01_FULL_38_9]
MAESGLDAGGMFANALAALSNKERTEIMGQITWGDLKRLVEISVHDAHESGLKMIIRDGKRENILISGEAKLAMIPKEHGGPNLSLQPVFFHTHPDSVSKLSPFPSGRDLGNTGFEWTEGGYLFTADSHGITIPIGVSGAEWQTGVVYKIGGKTLNPEDLPKAMTDNPN